MKLLLTLLLTILTLSVNASQTPVSGTVINQQNVAQYVDYLDKPMVDLLSKGLLTVTVAESIDIQPNARFLELTEKHNGTATIDPKTSQIINYQDGLPFPEEPTEDDPLAGLKLAWNMRYAYGGDTSLVDPFIWDYINMNTGKVERTLSFVGKILRYKHRLSMQPMPNLPKNPVNIFNGIYLQAKEPFDIKNTQLLVHRLEDDSARERTWLYLSVQRRVRRLPAGQTTDAFLGSDIMIEDFLGYNGRINDMRWRYLGTQQLLAPFYKHNPTVKDIESEHSGDYKFGTFHGQGSCFPNVPWQLRKLYVLEARPTATDHPLSKRVFYIDAQTHIPIAGRHYDRNNKIWRMGISAFSHPDEHLEQNKGTGVAIPSLISMIDVAANHCTTLKMKTKINDSTVKQKDFTVQSLRSRGK
ncbi:MAG: DUF1329 domain-containing protein [Cycloclasticus sp.]|jgi:hypothetical protein|nr:MAG: hypothetical protein AXW16_00215 [Cycloclasticus sp. Phe_18]MBV1912971.1 DUF1329 domain-containing protein [Cycloclasticus sp.]MDF1689586.1 DUF1329 domain-containing protein [Cycloclasticus sp.]MEE4290560.1 DUF1329 domain-containing protein [Cycloclasticus sp.]